MREQYRYMEGDESLSKILDNGTMRDATTEEQTNINTKIGGGQWSI